MKIETERTIIRLPKSSDFEFIKNLWLDGEVMNFVGFPEGLKVSDQEIYDWLHRDNKEVFRLIVEEKETKEPIAETGWGTGVKYPFTNSRKCTGLEIKIKKSYWGKGYGTEILHGVIDHIFENTNYKVVYVDPNIDNIGAVSLYKKLGFKSVGKPLFHEKKGKMQIPVTVQYYELENNEIQ